MGHVTSCVAAVTIGYSYLGVSPDFLQTHPKDASRETRENKTKYKRAVSIGGKLQTTFRKITVINYSN
jgi:hypothetical protein